MNFADDIWPRLQRSGHTWKYRRRIQPPTLIELHATRSGIRGRTAEQEYTSTINWFLAATNRVVEPSGDWASMASYIVGGGKVCRVLPEDIYPTFSLGHADPLAFSFEIAQNLPDTPFEEQDLELAAEKCADLSRRYNIPVRILPWLSGDNRQAPGYVRHDRSDNGRQYGKSDPGPLFNDREFEARVRRYLEEDDMSKELEAKMRVAGWFAQAQGLALAGKPLPMELRNKIRFVVP